MHTVLYIMCCYEGVVRVLVEFTYIAVDIYTHYFFVIAYNYGFTRSGDGIR